MSLQIGLATLLNNQSQVLPSLSYLSSFFKHYQQKKSLPGVVNSCNILDISLKNAQNSFSQLFYSKFSIVIADKLLQNLNSSSNDFSYDFKSDLFSELSKNHRFLSNIEDNILPNDCTRYIYSSFNKPSPLVNVHSAKLLNAAHQINLISQRNYGAPRHNYTGIGSLNKQYAENRKDFNLKLSNFYRKDKNDSAENEKIKNLLSDQTLSNEEKQRLKIAFAEGYGLADPKGQSKHYKAVNLIKDIFTIALILVVLTSFFGGNISKLLTGSVTEVTQEETDVTFEDVKGVEEAKQELQEIVEFLKNPEKFSKLGGKLPKGVLLVGPPGTGKTLLARAVAGEAGVPFFHIAGSEFDEILVGQGAKRVRDLFAIAKDKAPCVVFIDEIDSIGSQRSLSVLHPYANQTINQLLTEMDGFRQNEGVIVLGATNRRDALDGALTRPGRFDVEVHVSLPDLKGRREILKLYLSKIKHCPEVDLDVLARATTGFSGADLENMINLAAVRAAIDGLPSVTMEYFENSRDKVMMGPEKKSRIPNQEDNKITAYHEAGHVLVCHYTKDANPVHKVTIMPRGQTLGHTATIPERDQYHVTKSQLQARLDVLMGGRVAEELIFGDENITTGAFDDLKIATGLATKMVRNYGMTDKVAFRTFLEDRNSVFVGNQFSNYTSEMIDTEIQRILQESYERAKKILKMHSKKHIALAEALLARETLNAEDLKKLLSS